MPCRRLKKELARFTLRLLADMEWSNLAMLLRSRAVGNHFRLVVIGHGWIIWHRHWSVMVEQVGSGRMDLWLVENVWRGDCRVHHP